MKGRIDINAHIFRLDSNMGKSFKDPPAYHSGKPYSRWKTEIEQWAEMAKLNNAVVEATIGQVVVLSALPDSIEQGDIRGKVIDALGDKISGAEGFKAVLKWLDEHIGRDETQTCVDKAAAFMKHRRQEGQHIKDYLAGFDSKYNAAKSAGMGDMGEIFLMYMVIDHAGVSDAQFQLIMSQVDLKKKDSLYSSAKSAMIKFMAGLNDQGTSKDEGFKLKDSSTFFAKIPWKPKVPYQPKYPIRSVGGPAAPATGPRFGGAGAFAGGAKSHGPRTPVHIPRNPIKNGKQELCDICGSFAHFRSGCPYNPNVQAMTGILEQDQVDNGYLYHGDHVYISEQPQNIEDVTDFADVNLTGAAALPQNDDQKANDHVAALIASLNIGGENKKEEEIGVLVCHTLHTDMLQAGFGQVVLDTGCIKSVCASKWLNTFLNTLHPATRDRVKVEKSNRVFKFGGGQRRKSLGTFYIPCSIENKNIILVVDAVDQDDLPCLLSKQSMKKAGVIINIAKDEATIFDKTIKLKENAAGHYVIHLSDYIYGEDEVAVMWSGEDMDEEGMMTDLNKMHHGLGHPSQESMERMLKADGSFNKDVHLVLNKLYSNCLTCLKHKKAKPTPKVAPPMSSDVNDCITLDLKLYPKLGKNILYIIDDFSRYVTAVVIPDKKGETIVREFLDKWVYGTPYGPPRQIHSDLGGEFVNKELREMCDRLGIKHTTNGAFSAWSNGLNERNHHTVDLMLEKILDADKNIKFEDALAKAVYAKNTMINVNGFSPAQILTGRQPRLPGATNNNKPPEDETEVGSKTVLDRLKTMQMARDAFMKVDNGSRLKKAMQVAPSPLEHYPPGTVVYYRFGNDNRWHGPARTVGQENKVILIRHGGHIIATSQTRVFKAPSRGQMEENQHDNDPARSQVGGDTRGTPPPPLSGSEASDSDSDSEDDWGAPAVAAAPTAPAAPPAAVPAPAAATAAQPVSQPSTAGGRQQRTEGETGGEIETGTRQDRSQTVPDLNFEPASDASSVASPSATNGTGSPGQSSPGSEASPGSPPDRAESPDIERPERERFQFRADQLQRNNSEDNSDNMEPIRFNNGEKKKKTVYPKKGNWILYRDPEKNVWFRAQVLKKGVKASNPVPYYNIHPEYDSPIGVNLDEFEWVYDSPESAKGKVIYGGQTKKSPGKGGASPRLRKPIRKDKEYSALYTLNYAAYEGEDQIKKAEAAEKEDNSYVVFIPKEDWDKNFVLEAMDKELNNFANYKAYEEVEDVGQPRMSSGWVVTEKVYGSVVGAKVRLIVHGNQEGFEDRADSPTVSKQSLRLQFTLAAQMGWEIVMADITSAFLQSDNIDREIYVEPPKNIKKPGVIWRILKPMYGLGDASLQWYNTLAKTLIELGCIRLNTDPAMFYWYEENGKLGGIVAWHVDDKVSCGSVNFYEKVLTPLMNAFTFGSTSEGKYRCLGWNVVHKMEDILVSQEDYITVKVEHLDIVTRGHLGTDMLNADQASQVRALIGKLRWLADQCRPDIAYNLLELSIQGHAPTYDTVKLANKTVTLVKTRPYSIRYSKLESTDWKISVFADASLRGLPDKTSSAMGYVILLTDGFQPGSHSKVNVLSWKACKTRRIVASTYDAETLALTAALEEAVFIRNQLSRLLNLKEEELKIEAFCDCNDTVEAVLANKPLPNKNSRLAALEIARIKEMRELGMLNAIYWIPTRFQLADLMTKKGVNIEPLVETISKGRFFY